jgi:hypothetical protein
LSGRSATDLFNKPPIRAFVIPLRNKVVYTTRWNVNDASLFLVTKRKAREKRRPLDATSIALIALRRYPTERLSGQVSTYHSSNWFHIREAKWARCCDSGLTVTSERHSFPSPITSSHFWIQGFSSFAATSPVPRNAWQPSSERGLDRSEFSRKRYRKLSLSAGRRLGRLCLNPDR